MIGTVWNNVWPYLVAIGVFLILIVIHEFGHFIAAKLLGVRVNEFSIGFGPKLFQKQWGETKYAVGLVPFGGYCAMEGEDEDSTDDRAFCKKKPWRRFLIVVMGAAFNLLFGLLLIAIILAPQDRFASTVVAEFSQNAVSQQHGLKVDDRIVAVDGRRIFSSYDLGYSFSNIEDGKVDMTVVRDGKKVQLKNVQFATEEADGITYLTMDFYVYGIRKTLPNYLLQTGNTALSYAAVVWRSLVDLITGKFGLNTVSGPVGITVGIGAVAKTGLRNILPILALISINLGIFNLLPLPALDGGRLLFILFEMIFRRPVPQKYEAVVHAVGFALLLSLMVLVTAKDIFSLIF